jgi:hypothetical protein
VRTLKLTDEEIGEILPLVKEIASQHDSVEEAGFLESVSSYAQELPSRTRAFLNAFRLTEPSGVCVISGYPVNDPKIGKTPAHWRSEEPVNASTLEEEVFLNVCGALLGDAIAWAHQREGLICQDLVPIEEDQHLMLGSGSEVELVWHTEDARYSYRGDYIGLMCLRNPDRVPTTYASIDDIDLDSKHVDVLFKPQFVFHPDPSHPTDTESETAAILFGDKDSPYVRFDPYSMDTPEDREARQAFYYLQEKINEKIIGVALEPGDVMFIDNYKAVHGRNSFVARFDGTDRWLKRITIARDLRASRSVREAPNSRLIL